MQRVSVDVANGTMTRAALIADEVAEHQAEQEAALAVEQAEVDRRTDLEQRRATVLSELQAIRSAPTWAAAKAPLLRVLVFLLRRLGEAVD